MQIKTIRKVISDKMNEWLGTITDKALSNKLKENILVSGGSIVSMLTNSPVNDFDVYIKDRSVLMELVKYYTSTYTDIEILDGQKRQSYVDKIEENYSQNAEDVTDVNNAYAIAVRNLKDDQIKLFTMGVRRVNESEPNDEKKYIPKYFSPNAISLSDDIQIVIRFHGDSEAIHKTFDYVHATNYFTFEAGVVTNKAALESIIEKQLKYQGSMYPMTSIIRMKKFIKRDWNISAGEILKILFQVSELDLKNPDVLEEQLIGVDVAYFEKLIDILRGVDRENLTSQYLNTIIDRVFNQYEEAE